MDPTLTPKHLHILHNAKRTLPLVALQIAVRRRRHRHRLSRPLRRGHVIVVVLILLVLQVPYVSVFCVLACVWVEPFTHTHTHTPLIDIRTYILLPLLSFHRAPLPVIFVVGVLRRQHQRFQRAKLQRVRKGRIQRVVPLPPVLVAAAAAVLVAP